MASNQGTYQVKSSVPKLRLMPLSPQVIVYMSYRLYMVVDVRVEYHKLLEMYEG